MLQDIYLPRSRYWQPKRLLCYHGNVFFWLDVCYHGRALFSLSVFYHVLQYNAFSDWLFCHGGEFLVSCFVIPYNAFSYLLVIMAAHFFWLAVFLPCKYNVICCCITNVSVTKVYSITCTHFMIVSLCRFVTFGAKFQTSRTSNRVEISLSLESFPIRDLATSKLSDHLTLSIPGIVHVHATCTLIKRNTRPHILQKIQWKVRHVCTL